MIRLDGNTLVIRGTHTTARILLRNGEPVALKVGKRENVVGFYQQGVKRLPKDWTEHADVVTDINYQLRSALRVVALD